jgi:hypothetical protein
MAHRISAMQPLPTQGQDRGTDKPIALLRRQYKPAIEWQATERDSHRHQSYLETLRRSSCPAPRIPEGPVATLNFLPTTIAGLPPLPKLLQPTRTATLPEGTHRQIRAGKIQRKPRRTTDSAFRVHKLQASRLRQTGRKTSVDSSR